MNITIIVFSLFCSRSQNIWTFIAGYTRSISMILFWVRISVKIKFLLPIQSSQILFVKVESKSQFPEDWWSLWRPAFTISAKNKNIITTGGMKVICDYNFSDAPNFDILLIPGGKGTRKLISNKSTRLLRSSFRFTANSAISRPIK